MVPPFEVPSVLGDRPWFHPPVEWPQEGLATWAFHVLQGKGKVRYVQTWLYFNQKAVAALASRYWDNRKYAACRRLGLVIESAPCTDDESEDAYCPVQDALYDRREAEREMRRHFFASLGRGDDGYLNPTDDEWLCLPRLWGTWDAAKQHAWVEDQILGHGGARHKLEAIVEWLQANRDVIWARHRSRFSCDVLDFLRRNCRGLLERGSAGNAPPPPAVAVALEPTTSVCYTNTTPFPELDLPGGWSRRRTSLWAFNALSVLANSYDCDDYDWVARNLRWLGAMTVDVWDDGMVYQCCNVYARLWPELRTLWSESLIPPPQPFVPVAEQQHRLARCVGDLRRLAAHGADTGGSAPTDSSSDESTTEQLAHIPPKEQLRMAVEGCEEHAVHVDVTALDAGTYDLCQRIGFLPESVFRPVQVPGQRPVLRDATELGNPAFQETWSLTLRQYAELNLRYWRTDFERLVGQQPHMVWVGFLTNNKWLHNLVAEARGKVPPPVKQSLETLGLPHSAPPHTAKTVSDVSLVQLHQARRCLFDWSGTVVDIAALGGGASVWTVAVTNPYFVDLCFS
jgi:hypothetical protein